MTLLAGPRIGRYHGAIPVPCGPCMLQRPRAVTLVLFLTLLAATPLRAQEQGTWLDLGIGGGNNGANIELAITRRNGLHGLTFRGMAAARTEITLFTEKSSSRSLADLGLLYGVHGRSGPMLGFVRAGVGALWFDKSGTGGTQSGNSTGIGVPWEAGGTLLFGSNFGLGFRVAGNLNGIRNNVAGIVTLHLGKAY